MSPSVEQTHYNAWRQGFKAGHRSGWADCKNKAVKLTERQLTYPKDPNSGNQETKEQQ